MEIIVLASGSPRRKELLAKTGLKFSVVVSGGEEKAETSDPAETVEKLSLDKASAVADLLQAEKEPQLIIGADTVVACDGEILGKPSDREDAFRMLWKLQGQTHQVYTGVTLLLKKKHTWQAHTFSEKTDVQFYPVSREELLAYIETGEPMDNYDNFVKFVHMLTDEHGYHISQRNITVSTCGLVEKIRKLADEKLQITLAISLHAPNDEARRKLMPVANTYTIKEIMEACDYYFEKTGRRVSFEYSLVKDQNDSEAFAQELGRLLRGKNCHVNLIPVNPIKERDYKDSDSYFVEKFKLTLEKLGINVTIRREMGRDIDAACGQLRRSYMKQKEEE